MLYMEYVYAVYQEQSFSKAARKLFVSQPWLSATIKKVEQELQMPLFNRNTNPITLTEAGKYYIEKVEKMMELENEMRQHFSEMAVSSETQLHIGSSMFFCTYVLPTLMSEYKDKYPQVTLTFSEGTSAALTERLLEGKLDFLLEAEKPDHPQLTSMPWAEEEIVLAVPSSWKINDHLHDFGYSFDEFLIREQKGKSPVPLDAFADESFIMLQQGNDIYKRSMTICKNVAFSPKISLYLTQMMTAYYLVCEGRGIAFLRSTIPEYVTPTDRVVFYQLSDSLAVRHLYLSYRKKQSNPVQQNLIDFMRSRSLLPTR